MFFWYDLFCFAAIMCCCLYMNGKSEDKPLPSSLVVETEKPEGEKATVEVEYIESENLNDVEDAVAVLKVTFYDCIKSH